MSDLDLELKVIKGLELCVNRVPGKYNCNECPYEIDGNNCEINLTNDAIALLKKIVRCKICKHRSTSQCPCQSAGDPYYTWDPDDDWFCADGERR